MEHFVMRLYDGGYRVEKRVRQVHRTRDNFSVMMEMVGRRHVLVAHLHPGAGQHAIPNLYDVALIGTSSSSWVLSGPERVEAGPMRKDCLFGQTWLVEAAYEDDLIVAENRWTSAVREAHVLREELAALVAAGAVLTSPATGAPSMPSMAPNEQRPS